MVEMEDALIQKLKNLGCSSQVKLRVAFQVFMDLREVQKKSGLEFKCNKDLDIIYIIQKDNDVEEIYIPLSSASFLSTVFIMSLQKAVCPDQPEPRIILAVKEQDSTVIYYSLSAGLSAPMARREREKPTNWPHKRRRHNIQE